MFTHCIHAPMQHDSHAFWRMHPSIVLLLLHHITRALASVCDHLLSHAESRVRMSDIDTIDMTRHSLARAHVDMCMHMS